MYCVILNITIWMRLRVVHPSKTRPTEQLIAHVATERSQCILLVTHLARYGINMHISVAAALNLIHESDICFLFPVWSIVLVELKRR